MDNEKINSDNTKRTKLIIIFSIIAVLLIAGGMSYAYFAVTVNSDSVNIMRNITFDNGFLLNTTGNTTLNINVSDLSMFGTNEDVEVYNATYDIGIYLEESTDTSMICSYDYEFDYDTSESYSENAVRGLKVDITEDGITTEYSLPNTSGVLKNSHNSITSTPTSSSSKTVNITYRVYNLENYDQSELVNKNVKGSLKIVNVVCSEYKETLTNFNMKTVASNATVRNTISNISSSLVDGMYRIQGTKDNVKNNFICFNAEDTDCTNTDNLYRIIGLTSDGYLKIQKYTAYDKVAYYNPAGQTNNYVPINGFEESSLYTYLNEGAFYDSIGTKWLSYLKKWNWKTGSTTLGTSNGTDATTCQGVTCLTSTFTMGDYKPYYYENLLSNYDTSYYISLYSPSDYVDSVSGNNSATTGLTSWMINPDTTTYPIDWTNMYYGRQAGHSNVPTAWTINNTTGSITADNVNLANKYAVRPVFYLNNNVSIKSGEGTKEEPYILN